MRQMSQALAATATHAHGLHHRSDHLYGRAGGYDETVYDLVFGHSKAKRFFPSEEGEADISIPHVLGLRKATRIGIGHGYEFRERHDIGHFDAPRNGFCCVPTQPSRALETGGASYKSFCNGNVTERGKYTTKGLRDVSLWCDQFVAASPSPSRATIAGEDDARFASPAPIQQSVPVKAGPRSSLAAHGADKAAAPIHEGAH